MARRVVVYAGPTVSPQEILSVLPTAEVRPPAARGDMLAEKWRPGDVAVLVDGFFYAVRSVGHKEILRLLTEGVRVVGAGSMGALRAAELCRFGMAGVGEVFKMYAEGLIDGDDEVGLLHGPGEDGYPARTAALVNLRYGCDQAVAVGEMTSRDATRIVTTAKSISFVERSWAELSALLPSETRPGLEILRERIGSGEWDVKRRDALEAIALAEELPTAPVDMPAVVFTGISEHQLLVRRSEHEYMPGRTISDVDVLDAARLFGAVYPDIHERVLRGMLHQFASEEGLDLQTYASNKLGVLGKPVPPPLERWLTRSELVELPFDEQLVRLMTRVWPVWHSMDWRPRVLEDLRSHASWPEWVALVREADDETERSLGKLVQPAPSVRAQLFLRRWRAAGSSPRVEMARRGFLNAADLGRSLGRFFAYDLRSMKN